MLLFAGFALYQGAPILAQKGDFVTLDYRLSAAGALPFESTINAAPLRVKLGEGVLLKGLEAALIGQKEGSSASTKIAWQDGFGTVSVGKLKPRTDLVCEWRLLRIDSKERKQMVEIVDTSIGTGAVAQAGSSVEIHYTGKFLNGTKFDSSKDRNQTFTFKLGAGQVIKGFDLGVTGMKVGGKRTVTIPSELGYGSKGAGGVIPPDATLVFDLELVFVK